jgi:hypothetical protein
VPSCCADCGAAEGPAVELAPANGVEGLICKPCLVARRGSGRERGEAGNGDSSLNSRPEPKEKKEGTQATVLVGLALKGGAEFFHTPEGEGYATLPLDGRFETWPLRTKTVRRWLSRLYYLATESAPGSQAIADALGVLEGKALFDGAEHLVHTRVAAHGDATFLDLADAGWRAVEITAAGWRVMADPPVRFKRARGMLALPAPVPGGSLEELRPFLNFGTEEDFRLMVAWLVMTLRAAGPYPVLALHGEQGSGKSTAAEMLRMLVDPNEALLRPPPRDERDLVIAGSNGRVVALENLSAVPQWLSDALCRIATGSGFATRELYTDSDETIFSVQLPIVLNGIAEVVISGDLQDRAIVLTLPRIAEYVSEDALWEEFKQAQPRLLGALLDVVAEAMRREPTVKLDHPPRMADFARWTAAAAPALGWDADELLETYAANRAAANETTLDASPLVAPLRELGEFEGSATELLVALAEVVGDGASRAKVWPKSPAALSGSLRRLAPNLRRAEPGLEIEFDREAGRRLIRLTLLERVRKSSSSASSASSRHGTDDDDDALDDADDGLAGAAVGVNDADDDDDALLHTHSKSGCLPSKSEAPNLSPAVTDASHNGGPEAATEAEEAKVERIAARFGMEL